MALETRPFVLAGRYRVRGTVGIGGMARVYLADDERLGRRVAIKQLHSAAPEEAALRLEREARLGASLNHPNLVSVYDIQSDEESVLIVMEYVEGRTLADALTRGPLDPPETVRVTRAVAAALDHAHAAGVVHRDVKPANILLRRDGVVKLADLGIAVAAQDTRITVSGTVLGTAAYMAPEQLDGASPGPAADVYSLAAVAFEALSGNKARKGRTAVEIAHEIATRPPPDLRDDWPQAPAGAAAALTRGMAGDPAERQPTAGALADDLAAGLEPAPARTRVAATARAAAAPAPAPRAAARDRPLRRGGRPYALAALLGVAALAVAAALLLAGGSGAGGSATDRAGRAATTGARAPAKRSGSGGSGTQEPASARAPSGAPADGGAQASPPAGTGAPASIGAGGTAAPAGGSAAALNARGYALMRSGRYDEAIPPLQKAVAAFGSGSADLTYAYALYNLGRSLRLAGRPAEAVPVLERRLRIPNQTATVRRELSAARAAAR